MEITEEEKELSLSAQEAHNLIETYGTKGWKEIIIKKYFNVRLKECEDYIFDSKNNDITMIKAHCLNREFIKTLLEEIEFQVKIGLEDEEELQKRKEKKGGNDENNSL